MAINYFEMFGTLKMGIDLETLTDSGDVRHACIPGYTPAYTLRTENGEEVGAGKPVDYLVELAHNQIKSGPLTLFEDEYPVFTVG